MFGLIIGVILLILFPMWPYSVKLGVFYVSFYLLVTLVGIIIVRIILWGFMFIWGYDLWIFPNLFDDSKNPLNSFLPPLYFAVSEPADAVMYTVRGVFAVLFFGCCFLVYINFEITEMNSMLNDTFDWGKDKMIGNDTNGI